MTKLALQPKIDPASYARASQEVKGSLAFAEMPRLLEVLANDKGAVEYCLSFTVDEEKFVVIGVNAKAALPLICQRCMQPFEYKVKLYSELSPVTNPDKANDLPERYEAWPLSEEMTIVPIDIIEEELLLSLPIVPMHDEAICPATKLLAASKPSEQTATHKPFANLQKLK
ncbi:MAG: YceD family protein [Gammaproteobacteria bacterium]|nr:YceD family protein [Gammaproteobacteria bacterium]